MRVLETELPGAFLIEWEPRYDDRGFFARTFCAEEFRRLGLATTFVQGSLSHSDRRGTLRGLHYQLPPEAEIKLVRCTAGGIYDVIVDLRPESRTYRRHLAVELTAENGRSLYVPEQFAHGFQTLQDHTAVVYQMSAFFAPELARGLRYDDRALGIRWPLPVTAISEKDLGWPLLDG